MEKSSAIDGAFPECPIGPADPPSAKIALPDYLIRTYWWAYLHPKAVRLFERQWLVNLILWGNFSRLRDAALDEIGAKITGSVLQVACVYGDFTPRLAERLDTSASLDVIDVAPVQLENAERKVGGIPNVALHHQDSTELSFPDQAFDCVVVFFLLHEQPAAVRARTLREALRVVREGGKLIIVDYHRPRRWHPLRYLMRPILKTLEPFALDLWNREIVHWAPGDSRPSSVRKKTFFGGLYQKTVMTR